ncbi:hypothetical protein D8Y22_01845 [Salinadaptatus halalkaliphilus]|uniref:Uncharacterized protein n=1 Tax=Salinadaptatus halalkaliphilus TaxID=2419781 RepID=A0A4S3TT15_9EURY|nr:hypothetical protein [Salinadaptatus halalkaliphilus]THE66563.1 hypothetical protein D8Y22_01845 [Salinadaptatus halalkaliphilus]
MSDDEMPGAGPEDLPEGTEGLEQLVEGEIIELVLSPYLDVLGPVFAVVLIGGIFTMLWIWAGDISLPIVVGIVLSGLLVTVLPWQLVGLLEDLLIIGMAVALFSAWWMRTGGGLR